MSTRASGLVGRLKPTMSLQTSCLLSINYSDSGSEINYLVYLSIFLFQCYQFLLRIF